MVPADGVHYCRDGPLFGAWVIGGEANPPLYPGSTHRASRLQPNTGDNTAARRLMVGYNFGAISPLARPYTGIARTRQVPSLVDPQHPGRT